ncbi:hypothetical protein [Kordiimonas aestuarii]|uniref:hypothetical protein n=1 Tax=Kordiimonas aestuarii TaxID=1005925 RepID=UPI0021D39633|nr:hypothetical protein [Kordiimonas aestuarii]
MRLIIIDPSLDAYSGHHLSLDLKVAHHFGGNGAECLIIGHRAFPDAEVEGVPIRAHFRDTAYGALDTNIYARAHDEFVHFNDRIFEDLCALPDDFFQPGDLLFAPTVTEKILEGLLRWHAQLRHRTTTDDALPMTVFLMMPSGLYFNDTDPQPTIIDAATAMFYRLALRQADSTVTLIGTGHEHAREYSEIIGHSIPAYALMADTTLNQTKARAALGIAPAAKVAVLYAGDCKAEKGFNLLPRVVESLCTTCRDWTFIAHINARAAWGSALDTAETLRQHAGTYSNFVLHDGYLPTVTYRQIIAAADVTLIPYDREHYRGKSSGILWEALNAGSMVLCPNDCWLDKELAAWQGAGLAYDGDGPDTITEAFGEVVNAFAAQRAKAAMAAKQFQHANSLESLYKLMTAGPQHNQRTNPIPNGKN